MSASCAYVGTVRHRRVEPAARVQLSDLPPLPRPRGASGGAPGDAPVVGPARRRSRASGASTSSATRRSRWPTPCARWPGARPAWRRPARCGCSPACATSGMSFNPVAFYFCFRPGGEELDAVVAEVTNTPWGERHAYAVAADGGSVVSGRLRKAFHVSPLMGMDHEYELRASGPREPRSACTSPPRAAVERAFDATMSLRRRELGPGTLDRLLMRYPAMTMRVLAHDLLRGGAPAAEGRPLPPAPRAGGGLRTRTRAANRPRARGSRVRGGQLTIEEGGRRHEFGDPAGRACAPRSRCNSPHAWPALLSGSLGLGRGYAAGWWDTDDLPALIALCARSIGPLDTARRRLWPLLVPIQRRSRLAAAQHALTRARQRGRPLRPRQRPVPAVPGRVADLLERDLPAARDDPRAGAGGEARPRVPARRPARRSTGSSRSGPAGGASRCTPARATAARC